MKRFTRSAVAWLKWLLTGVSRGSLNFQTVANAEIDMSDADLEHESEGRFFIKDGSVPVVRPSLESLKKDFVDESVHEIGAPKLTDLWRNFTLLPNFMPLFKVLVWRSISLRYSQSFLGVLWVAIQPIASTVMVFFMFAIIKINTADGSHQGIFLFTGIMTWQFFARALQDATGSLLAHAGILTKIYLPKIMLPLASVMAAWFDMLVVTTLLIIGMSHIRNSAVAAPASAAAISYPGVSGIIVCRHRPGAVECPLP